MKLSSLSPEQKTRLLAELDGWQLYFDRDKDGVKIPHGLFPLYAKHGFVKSSIEPPSYLTSYDAIIPLVQKLPRRFQHSVVKHLLGVENVERTTFGYILDDVLFATPSQLCDAVLVATGKCTLD